MLALPVAWIVVCASLLADFSFATSVFFTRLEVDTQYKDLPMMEPSYILDKVSTVRIEMCCHLCLKAGSNCLAVLHSSDPEGRCVLLNAVSQTDNGQDSVFIKSRNYEDYYLLSGVNTEAPTDQSSYATHQTSYDSSLILESSIATLRSTKNSDITLREHTNDSVEITLRERTSDSVETTTTSLPSLGTKYFSSLSGISQVLDRATDTSAQWKTTTILETSIQRHSLTVEGDVQQFTSTSTSINYSETSIKVNDGVTNSTTVDRTKNTMPLMTVKNASNAAKIELSPTTIDNAALRVDDVPFATSVLPVSLPSSNLLLPSSSGDAIKPIAVSQLATSATVSINTTMLKAGSSLGMSTAGFASLTATRSATTSNSSIVNINAVNVIWLQIPGVIISDGREENLKNVHLTNVTNVNACYSACKTLTNFSASCTVFAYSATLGDCIISNVNFYDDWTSLNDSSAASEYTSYVEHWKEYPKLLFKASSGTGVALGDFFVSLGVPSNDTASAIETALNNSCRCNLKNGLLKNWAYLPWKKVRLVFAVGGLPLKFLELNATKANVSTFFTVSRIINSSWTDLCPTCKITTMDLGAPKRNADSRYFVIQRDPRYSCGNDVGWMLVSGTQGPYPACGYDKTPIPQFGYSPRETYSSLDKFQFADVLLLYGIL